MVSKGINYYSYDDSNSRYRHNGCVFISHQKKDAKEAKKIADFLISKGISVYFDEYDLKIDRSNPDSVVSAIKRGIDYSEYMLCLISKNTIASTWVPWEVGYGYDKTKLAVLTLKGILTSELPEYLRSSNVIKIIRGYTSFRDNIMNNHSLNESAFEKFDFMHPLYNVLDI